ncbi:hypothetical protein [Methanobrevibacter filiformis]|uniref:Putative outer membrane protein pmp19 n=1 Tax=Methanobrevibacter filiformis TaxID=55758 RepID=A0A166CHX6_9EURY|nr:hypothetical protein [Methanobrevibacter filiformis]KZX14527.1 putative outer membrane protein pmp19 precursor [Methanobrevibacter filiformis]
MELVSNYGVVRVVHIAGGNYNNNNNLTRNNTNLTINSSVILLGETTLSGKVILDGLNNGRIFNVNIGDINQSLTLVNLTFVNGNVNGSDGNGSALYIINANTTISNSEFINNSANFGGAIYNNDTSNNFKIIDSNFTSNLAINNGGAIYLNGPKSSNILNSTFINLIFNNNSATNGGAIYNNVSNFNLTNSTFMNNSATNGGAIYNNVSNFNLTNSTFMNNRFVSKSCLLKN